MNRDVLQYCYGNRTIFVTYRCGQYKALARRWPLPMTGWDMSTILYKHRWQAVYKIERMVDRVVWGGAPLVRNINRRITYFVDPVGGNDDNDGLSKKTALASIVAALKLTKGSMRNSISVC